MNMWKLFHLSVLEWKQRQKSALPQSAISKPCGDVEPTYNTPREQSTYDIPCSANATEYDTPRPQEVREDDEYDEVMVLPPKMKRYWTHKR